MVPRSLSYFAVVLLVPLIALLLARSDWPASAVAAPVQQPQHLVAGEQHTCAITSSGGVMCWGDNYYGQLGDGGANRSTATPVQVIGLTSGVIALTSGDYHTCALLTGGGVKCWGRNSFGQLGDNSIEAKSAPVTPGTLSSGVSAIAAGRDHTCAVTTTGSVQCWGLNNGGQLGDGTTDGRATPVAVVGLSSGVSILAAGNMHTCALLSSSGVQCWGRNAFGQLGDGTSKESLTPVDVLGLSSGVTALTVGYDHTCALLSSGGMQCWGRNDAGQLGDGTTTQHAAPVNVVDLDSGVRVIAASYLQTCAITNANTVQCWGDNSAGQLGDGTAEDHIRPRAVDGVNQAGHALATGVWHTCVALNDGRVNCWGWNGVGQLGIGAFPDQLSPVDVVGLTNIGRATAGGAHTCAVTSDGGAKCWGANFYGQLGDNTSDSQMAPVAVTGLSSGVSELAAGTEHTCALMTTGSVKCWGRASDGQLGNNDTLDSQTPVDVVGLSSGVTALTAGDYHTCVVIGGGVRCWGQNDYGQVGDGTTTNRLTPVAVISPGSGVSAIAAGLWHTCAVIGSGVKCWGKNDNGQLGDGTTINQTTPVTVSGLSGVSALAAGAWHTCAVTSSGSVKCWGRNTGGEAETTPVDIVGLSDVRALGAGKYHTCALTNSGAVKCWGGNHTGQLGNGTLADNANPGDVSGLSSGMSALAAGEGHNCAVTSSGGVKCWGNNYEGQLGDGAAWRTTPVAVVGVTMGAPSPTPTATPTGATPTATVTVTLTPTGEGDAYEDDNSCAQARALSPDGAVQPHTFHTTGDADWLRFDAVAGVSYLVQADVPSDSAADVVVELYAQCDEQPGAYPDENFAPGVQIEFKAPTSGPLFFKITNREATVAGATVRYEFAVRALDTPIGALIVVAGSIGANDPVLTNIYQVTDAVRRLFIGHGYDDDHIQYLAANPAHANVDGAATIANLQAAITTWAIDKVGADRALTLYMMDHGSQDRFYLNKPQDQTVTPAQLDDWLRQLEASRPGLKVNVILEACYAGSFISPAATISGPGRVVIASTSDSDLAWASQTGAYFSDYLLAALDRKASLANSFQQARLAVVRFHRNQQAWIDGDGNGTPNEPADYAVAAQRGFGIVGSLPAPPQWPPYIDQATGPTVIEHGEGLLRAHVRDDEGVKHVWAVIYPPSYTPPNSSEALVRDEDDTRIATIRLADTDSDGWYSATHFGFDQPGAYQIVIYAEDEHGLNAQPVVLAIVVGQRNFLPLIIH